MTDPYFDNEIITNYREAVAAGIPYQYIVPYEGGYANILAIVESYIDEGQITDENVLHLLSGLYPQFSRSTIFFMLVQMYEKLMEEALAPDHEFLTSFQDFLAQEKITTEPQFKKKYEYFQENQENDRIRTENVQVEIERIQEELISFDKNSEVVFGTKKINSIRYVYDIFTLSGLPGKKAPLEKDHPLGKNVQLEADHPLGKNVQLQAEHFLEFFEAAKATKIIPYISLSLDGLYYTKIYQNPDFQQDLNMIIPKIKPKYEKINHILMTIWLGGLNKKNSNTIKQNDYDKILIDLEEKKLMLKIPKDFDRKIIIKALEETFIGYTFANEQIRDIKADFEVTGLKFQEEKFLDAIMNDQILSEYLYMDEKNNSYAEKTRFDLHFQDLFNDIFQEKKQGTNAVSVAIVEDVDVEEVIDAVATEGAAVGKPKRNYLINVNTVSFILTENSIKIKSAPNEKMLDKFYHLMPALFSYYLSLQDSEIYDKISLEKNKKKVTKADTDIVKNKAVKTLRGVAPEIFTPQWTAKKGQKQPISITKNEYIDDGKHIRIPYPDFFNSKTYLYFASDNLEFPYISVMLNPAPEYSKKFPYAPKLYTTDRRKQLIHQDFLNREVFDKKKPVTGKAITLFDEIKNILLMSPDKGPYDLQTVPKSNNSFIHCILTALDIEEYVETTEEKEEYVDNFRSNLFNMTKEDGSFIVPALLKQELYNSTEKEIIKQVTGTGIFLSSLYYRIFEELFDINIYTFVQIKHEKTSSIELEIPRHKSFYARIYRNRLNILLYKHFDDQYYLITRGVGEGVFSETPLYHDIMHKIINNYIIYRDVSDKLKISVPKNLNLSPPISQVIDDNGKVQIFNYKDYSLYLPPHEPQNCPSVDKDQFLLTTEKRAREVIKSLTVVTAVTSATTALSVSINSDNLVDGIWFTVGPDLSLYIPIKAERAKEKLEIIGYQSPIKPLLDKLINNRLYYLKKQLNIIVQLVRWLFDLSGLSPDEFIEQYVMIGSDSDEIDSLIYFDILDGKKKIPRLLPSVKSVEEGLKYLAKYTNLVTEGHEWTVGTEGHEGAAKVGQYLIQAYNDDFKNKLLYMLIQYEYHITGNKVTKALKNYYLDVEDFTPHKYNKIFVSREDFVKWYLYMTTGENILHTTLEKEKILHAREPMVYVQLNNFYIIQNTNSGSLEDALFLSYHWYQNHNNYGYIPPLIEVEEDFFEDMSYNVYEISSDRKLKLIENKSAVYSILRLPGVEPKYIAMLKI